LCMCALGDICVLLGTLLSPLICTFRSDMRQLIATSV